MKHTIRLMLLRLVVVLFAPSATAFGILPLPNMVELFQHSTVIASSSSFSLIPGSGLLDAYTHQLRVHPLETKMATGAVLATLGDAIAQSREPEEYDAKRATSFMAFDVCYRALQHQVFPWIVATCHGQYLLGALAMVAPQLAAHQSQLYFGAMEQTLASQLGVVPFIYYPVFFALTGAVQGLSMPQAVERAQENFGPLLKRNLLYWIPVQFIQFAYVEEGLQIPFLCACGVVWTIVLSVMAGSTKHYCVTGMEGECLLPDELFPEHDGTDLLVTRAFSDLTAEANLDEALSASTAAEVISISVHDDEDFVINNGAVEGQAPSLVGEVETKVEEEEVALTR